MFGGVPLPIVGAGQYTCRRRYITFGIALALSAAIPGVVAAQRVIETHSFSEPEGRLLAFYSAAMAFSPAGIAPDQSRIGIALEASYVPSLNRAQRRPTIDKPESTNLAPFFPRPRLSVRFGGWRAEASWIPPMEVFSVKANLTSAALSLPARQMGQIALIPRFWGMLGRVEGAMTCSTDEMIGHGADLELYYNTVCHGRESNDWFEPRMLGGELVGVREICGRTCNDNRLYALLGARIDRTRFDIGVLTPSGARDPEHPVLRLETFRPHVALGVTWRVRERTHVGGELFYAPGSLLTLRVSGRWAVRPGPIGLQ